MKLTKDYLRKLIREGLKQTGQVSQVAEAAGKRIFFVGVMVAYESDTIYGVFDSEGAARKGLKQLQAKYPNKEYGDVFSVWSYPVTNSIMEQSLEPEELN